MEVVAILRGKFPDADDELLAQAMGHDIIEDTDETRETLLQKGMTERIVDGIEGVSKDPEKRESMDDYKARVFENEDRMKVKLSDLTHNSDLSRLKKVRDKDVERQSRYLQFAAEIEARLGLTAAPKL